MSNNDINSRQYSPKQQAYADAKAKYDAVLESRAYKLGVELFEESLNQPGEMGRILSESSERILKECGYNAAHWNLFTAENDLIVWAYEFMKRLPDDGEEYARLFNRVDFYTKSQRVEIALNLKISDTE